MKRYALPLSLIALLVAGCGGNGATKFGGPPPDPVVMFGTCAFCHADVAGRMAVTGAGLTCEVCHADRMPGSTGPGHRAIPGPDQVPSFVGPSHQLGAEAPYGLCAYCHNQFAVSLTPFSGDLRCQTCHADQIPGFFGPGHRAIPGPDQVPSFVGPSHQVGAEAPFGSCAVCHNQFAVNLTSVSGDLKCWTCHADQIPGFFGPGHRAIPGPDQVPSFVGPSHDLGAQAPFGSCALCHNQFAINLTPYSANLNCPICHADQHPGEFGPGHRSLPGPDKVPSPAGPSHQLGPQATLGYCAFCHNQFAVNLTPYSSDLTCPVCHQDQIPGTFGPGHESIPGPDKVPSFVGPSHQLGPESMFGVCGYCHNRQAVKLTISGGHGGDLTLVCERCHGDLRPGEFGPGHRSVPACADCHSTERTHEDPAAGTPRQCFVCHTPHGSSNLFLVREQILTPAGTQRVVEFTNLNPVADGGFVSVTPPVRGVCQVCHTTTKFYRADGSGDTHFAYPCYTCHLHTNGFTP